MNEFESMFNELQGEPIKMGQKEFLEKTKALLNKVLNSYCQGWQSRSLMDDEYPEESVCDKCTGTGTFMNEGEEKECIIDGEAGYCYHKFCDYEQVGMDLVAYIDDMLDLIGVDELTTEEQQ